MENHSEKITDNNISTDRIVIRGTNWIGDCLLTTPAVRAIRKRFPGARIDIIVRPKLADLFLYNPHLDNVIPYNPGKNLMRIPDFIRLVMQTRKQKYTKAVLFQNAIEAALIAFCAGIPYRLGYARDMRSPFLTHAKHAVYQPDRHQVYYYLDLVTELGGSCDDPQLEIFPGEEHVQEAKTLLRSLDPDPDKPVTGFAPGAAYGSAKRWPLDSFVGLGKKLVRETESYVWIFGGSTERNMGQNLQAAIGERCFDFTGKTSILTASALMRECNTLVSNDSGAMHMGVATGTKVVALFGPTNPNETGPLGNNHVIVRKQFDCAPCRYRECPEEHQCMSAITVDEVFNHVVSLLQQE